MADELELNLVFNAPKPRAAPTERVVKRAEYREAARAKKAAPRDQANRQPRNKSPAERKPTQQKRAGVKRKGPPTAEPTAAAADDEEEDADGDAQMAEANEGEEGAVTKATAWKSIKQARFEGDSSVSFSSSPSAAAAAAAADSGSDGVAAAASDSASSTKKPPFRPVSKPLPKIQRHAAAQLDARAFQPVAPSGDTASSVFGLEAAASTTATAAPATEPVVKIECGVVVKEELPPLPTTGFGTLGLSERLLRCLVEKLGLKYPTKIQKEGIPLILTGGRDALIKSETGTGKTLTYLIPIVERLTTQAERGERGEGTRAIILSPTRELCLQIHGVLSNLLEKGGFYWLVSGIIMGGEKKKSEKARLRRGIHVLICTPGRLLDHLENTECLVLSKLSYFVLDEADRLMDMGFERDLTKIVALLDDKSTVKPPPSAIVDPRTGLEIKSARTRLAEERNRVVRQNLLVSATLNSEIEAMARITLKDPLLIGFKTAAPEEGLKLEGDEGATLVNGNAPVADTSMPVGLVQLYLQVEHRHKIVALASLLRKKVVEAEMNNAHFKAVVFFSTCAAVEFHHSLLKYSYWPYDRSAGGFDAEKRALIDTQLLKLHGNLTQQERTKTYQQFCKNAEGILLCTDVAARGLDLPAVDYIFQYDPPEDTADYIHRVGRTARMGRKGQAILFLMSSELDYLSMLKERGIAPEPLSFAHILQSLHSDAAKNRIYDDARGGSPAGAILQKQFEALVANQLELKESAINAYHSYLRAYAAYPKQLKHIFHPRKLHIGHVARSFGLNDAPTALARSEIVSKQRTSEAREKEREQERRDLRGDTKDGAPSVSAFQKKKLVPQASSKPTGDGGEGISSGIRPAFGQRDRQRNAAAQAGDAAFEQRKREKKPKMEASSLGWKLGSESGSRQSSTKAKTGIDRVRSIKVAQAFKKSKVDLSSEFAS